MLNYPKRLFIYLKQIIDAFNTYKTILTLKTLAK